MSRAVPPDAIGYPGKPGKPTPVDPETANLWRSLGIHIPPQTLRDSRENHERSLHKILTAIAIKLEKLSRSSAESGGAMARQDEVNAEFAKVRKEMSIMDTKALSAARAAGQSAVAALTEKVTRTDQKLKLLTTQSTTMRRELSEVKHILAEEDAADAALDNNDVDYLEMSKDEDAVKEMYAQVTEQADRAEQKMMEVLLEQQSKNAELSAMRAEMSGANARSQDLFQRQSAGQADREARLQEEIRKMQSEMSSGGDQMAALQQEQAAAMAEAEASATQRMLDLHSKLDAEQEQLKASMSGDSKESAEAMEKQIAALNAKMKEEAAALDKARNQVSAAAERKQAKLREEMDQQQAAMRAKMASLESQSIMDAAAAEAKTASLLDQLQKEQAEMAAKDDGKKTEAQKEAEKRNAAEIDRLQSMISDQANQAPIATGTPEEMQKIFEQLEAERAKLDSMQQSHAVAEGDMEKGLTSEMKRLQKQLEAAQKESADGSEGAASRAESLAAELQGQQAEAEKRAAHEKMIREAEQAAIMQQMARLQSALESERDKTLTLEQQQEVDAAAKAQNELAASMATLQEDLAASKQKMESMEANGDTQGSEQAAQARSANEALEAKLAAEQARMKEMETAAASAQANMMSGMEETQRRAAQQMSDMEAQMRSQLGAIGDASAMAEAEQKALGASRTAARAAMGSRGAGKTRVQRKLEQKVEVEELRGRVGALTIKMGRLTKLLTMMDGADDIPGLLKILREQKADRSELKELEDRLVAAGVGGGASMGNALRQMEENITEHAAQIANIIVTKADVGDVNGAADRAKEDLMAELEKHAAQLAKLYAETTGRMDGLDEDKAERDWIEDLIAKIRRQVAGLKKKVNEGAVDGAMDGLSGMLSGQISMFVKGENPKGWPPNIDQLPSPRTGSIKKRSGLGQQLVYRGGFPMASNSVSIPSRMSTDNVSGVTRQSFSSSYANSGNLSRSATASLLPRLAGAVDPFTTDGAGGPKLDESTVLTEDLVNRFRQSIWPPPSIPAFGSWPDATDVLDRARDIVSAQSSMMGSSNGMHLLSTTGGLGGGRQTPLSPTRKPSMLSSSKGRVKGTAAKLPPASGRRSAEPSFGTSQTRVVSPSKASGRESAGA